MNGTDNDIERYHKGTLSPAERHALEKKALSDPFLADALEGSEQLTGDAFTQDVARLNARIRKPKTLFTPLRIAAGVIVVVAAGWFGLYVSNQTEPDKLTSAEVQPGPTGGAKDSAAGDTAEPKQDELLSLKRPEEEKPKETKNERIQSVPSAGPSLASGEQPTTASEEEADLVEEQSAKKADELTLASGIAVTTDSVATPLETPSPVQSLARTEEKQSRARAAADDKQADFISSEGAKMKKIESTRPTVVSGQVTLADDGLALPGVNVRVKGSATGTVTDLNGYYSLPVNDPNTVLTFSFIGLQTQEATQGSATKLDVKLAEDVSQLSEVVVTGKATPVDLSGEPVIKLAEPVGGLRAYDKYLEGNLQYPQQALDNNIKGRVSVQFTVAVDGKLGEFQVMRSLGFGCDEEVIRLVKDGPAWIPSTENNVPTESLVRVRMRFDPSKKK